ncbi:hypothetical protein GGP48_002329 [Salinibacter ruber]|nr:hypothetical protein [Salinibacter ruber]MCS4187626.1 hypothetical protein [Salinibacter ruber]
MLTNRAAANPGRSLDALKTAYKRFFEQHSPEEVL